MRIPFAKNENKPWITVEFGFTGDEFGTGSISVASDGAGAFIEIKADEPIRMDVADVEQLAEWAREACRELDEWNGETIGGAE